MYSIIIPAHNEETVIARCIRAIITGAAPGELEVIVACNGCTDRTAEIAREFGDPVRVLEIKTPSKVAALNAADAAATGFPRFYIDADVVLDLESIRRMAAALDAGEGLAAWPEPVTDLSGCSWPVRAFYAVWQALPYNRDGGRVGAGVYALSREGRARFDRFPDVINDDRFVRSQFAPTERITPEGTSSRVEAPRTLASLVRVKTRVRVGQYQLRRMLADKPVTEPKSLGPILAVFLRRPYLLACLPVYVGVTLWVKMRARAAVRNVDSVSWSQDRSTRMAACGVHPEQLTIDG